MDHPTPHENLEHRINRAKKIKYENNITYPVYVDTWDNNFDKMYRAWPDQYYYVDSDGCIINMSTYENRNPYVDNDCYVFLSEILNKTRSEMTTSE